MTQGTLRYNASTDRFDVIDKAGKDVTFGGLRCGQALEAKIGGRYQPTRIELCGETDAWYLVGFKSRVSLEGLRVRVRA